nr:hypothetical protein [Comamonas testosteroni]
MNVQLFLFEVIGLQGLTAISIHAVSQRCGGFRWRTHEAAIFYILTRSHKLKTNHWCLYTFASKLKGISTLAYRLFAAAMAVSGLPVFAL